LFLADQHLAGVDHSLVLFIKDLRHRGPREILVSSTEDVARRVSQYLFEAGVAGPIDPFPVLEPDRIRDGEDHGREGAIGILLLGWGAADRRRGAAQKATQAGQDGKGWVALSHAVAER